MAVLRLLMFRLQQGGRIGAKLCQTARTAKVISLILIGVFACGGGGIDLHAANRIGVRFNRRRCQYRQNVGFAA